MILQMVSSTGHHRHHRRGRNRMPSSAPGTLTVLGRWMKRRDMFERPQRPFGMSKIGALSVVNSVNSQHMMLRYA